VALVAGCHVLLVDDVLTTGATASEAALSLASMGAAGVTLLTYARALPNAPRRPA
jgi:predicted amidophosphoribosyltransferase